jgi:hypothetical protein
MVSASPVVQQPAPQLFSQAPELDEQDIVETWRREAIVEGTA